MSLTNEAVWDRAARILGGLVLLTIAWTVTEGLTSWVAMGVGAVLLATGFVGWCPAYNLFGIRTLRKHA